MQLVAEDTAAGLSYYSSSQSVLSIYGISVFSVAVKREVHRTFRTALLSTVPGLLVGDDLRRFSGRCNSGRRQFECCFCFGASPLLDFLGTDAARKEILHRRAGQNEISNIGVLQELVNVRCEYCSTELPHAQKILSDALRHNGLYWEAAKR